MKSLIALAALSLSFAATAQDAWPAKPLHIVVPFGPGGANDIVARAVCEAAGKILGQPVVIENRPGAGSVVGAAYVAKSAPDGYTFLAPAAGVVTNALIKARMPYAEGDLVPVVMLAVSPSVIVVPSDSPIKDLKGLIAASKTAPGGLNFSTAGTGSTPHFVAEMLKIKGGAKLQIVPYKSGNEGMAAVAGHQVDATSEGSPVVLPMIKGGRLRPLASTWSRRIAALPDIPTAQEQGFGDLVIGHWSGLFAPKGTPEPILDKLNAAVNQALKSSELRARLIPMAIDPMGGSREEFRQFLASEKARLGAVVKASGMKED
jgi:tripartite-type tricarboxylate transporter receptor subunit TctC